MKKYTEAQAQQEYNDLMETISNHIELAQRNSFRKTRFAISIQTLQAIDLLMKAIDIDNRVDIAYNILTDTTIMILQYNLC